MHLKVSKLEHGAVAERQILSKQQGDPLCPKAACTADATGFAEESKAAEDLQHSALGQQSFGGT